MQISARNQLEGIIREINEGPINSEITIEVAPEIMVTAQITTSSVRRLQLTVGKKPMPSSRPIPSWSASTDTFHIGKRCGFPYLFS